MKYTGTIEWIQIDAVITNVQIVRFFIVRYNKYTDRTNSKPTECKVTCIHKWISALIVTIHLYLFINETGELLFIFIMRKPNNGNKRAGAL